MRAHLPFFIIAQLLFFLPKVCSLVILDMSEREAVFHAIKNVIELNKEAGTSSDSLTSILVAANVDGLEKFCTELLAPIKGCFDHFKKVKPHLAKMRAHRDFHQARIGSLPKVWEAYREEAGFLEVQPIDQQAVNRELFERCLRDLLTLPITTADNPLVKLLADEENAVRYAAGYVAMKISRKLDKLGGPKVDQFKECLLQMKNTGDDSSYYNYTSQWIKAVNRGGLFVLNDATFNFFKAIEVKVQELLPQHLSNAATAKKDLHREIMDDDLVGEYWSVVADNINEKEDSDELLAWIVDMWVTMRGFSLTSHWMEVYKQVKGKNLKKTKSLRQELLASTSED